MVRASCRRCGPIEIPATEVSVIASGDGTAEMDFSCPSCSSVVTAAVDSRVAASLQAGGAEIAIDTVSPRNHAP